MKDVLSRIVADATLHRRWLNTLSFMENAGARKISASEDPINVSVTQLKHAAEEHRHAYYLRKQTRKLDQLEKRNDRSVVLLAPLRTRQYLHQLDVQCSRYLKLQFGLNGQELKFASYLFVTYVIEVRADALYPVYQQALSEEQSNVTVKSIIAEEEGHLEEMTALLEHFDPDWQRHALHLQTLEAGLFNEWFAAIANEVSTYEQASANLA